MDGLYVIGRDALPERIVLNSGEKLRLSLVALPGTVAEVSLNVDICGSDCEADIRGVYLCSGNDRLKINVLLRHLEGGSVSRQLFKGIAGGASRVDFDGQIYIAHGAMRTEAYQEAHSVLLSADAKVESRPQLEIYADDVQCSHGCTSGYLDSEAEFYMRSRGIPENEARRLQKIAFLAPVVEHLPEELKREIYDSIS